MIYEITTDVCTQVNNANFLRLFEKRFVEKLLVKNSDKLKLMDDPSNPFYHLLKLARTVESSPAKLLLDLLGACTTLIKLNDEEIRRHAFVCPTVNTCTYAILFEKHLNGVQLTNATIDELKILWNRWTHNGLTKAELQIWNAHHSNERQVFQKIWKHVQQYSKKPKSVDVLFEQAELDYQEKIQTRDAILSTLTVYCDQANDQKHWKLALDDMLKKFEDVPIRLVEMPSELREMIHIAKTLYQFSTSKVWLNYHNRSHGDPGKEK